MKFTLIILTTLLCSNLFAVNSTTHTDPEKAAELIDYKIQGEYKSAEMAIQVIALDQGKFCAVILPGGLPGDGWDMKTKYVLHGKLDGNKAHFFTPKEALSYCNQKPEKFSPVNNFNSGQHLAKFTGSTDGKTFTFKDEQGKVTSLKRVIRISPTMGLKPPKGAIVLFDGANKNEFTGKVDPITNLLNTYGSDIYSKEKFNSYKIHIEFLLPFKPGIRGQNRGNGGFYQVDHYEVQMLDSFALDGLNNECGGVYSKLVPKLNMCLPPLQWQTYDIEFTNAVSENGKKIKNAILTARLNGVLVHENAEIDGKTGGSRNEPEGTPGRIKLQGHGNPLQFRNIWIIKK